MHIINSLESLEKVLKKAQLHVALGNFDGVHVGHQHLIGKVVKSGEKPGHESVVVTFDPHPSEYFAKATDFKKIDDKHLRRRLLASLRVSALLELRFDEQLAEMTAQDFLMALTTRVNIRQISVGSDFRFGKGRQGDAKFLHEFCTQHGIESDIVQPFMIDGVIASSSQVRAWLRQGEVEKAARMLGRPFTLVGSVIHGAKMGRKVGFPTANIKCSDQLVPLEGVYAGTLVVGSDMSSQLRPYDEHACVINIGYRPTVSVDAKERSIEAHIYDVDGSNFDLYDQVVELRFYYRLREERKFSDIDALQKQIALDIQHAKLRSGD